MMGKSNSRPDSKPRPVTPKPPQGFGRVRVSTPKKGK